MLGQGAPTLPERRRWRIRKHDLGLYPGFFYIYATQKVTALLTLQDEGIRQASVIGKCLAHSRSKRLFPSLSSHLRANSY